MNIITFPMLNLKLNIKSIAFAIFGIEIYWYSILIVLAILLSFIILKKRDGLYNIYFKDILDLGIYIIPISIISARLYFIIFKLEYYINNHMEILNFRAGGLAIYGGIIGGVITCYIFCKKRKIKILDLFDYIIPVLALRSINRKMGKLYKCRSIRNTNKFAMENGNI